MFKKVLVVEDLDTVGHGILTMLKQDLGITNAILSQYCDDAYLKFQSALKSDEPFDLLITDLSFTKDHRPYKLKSGEELINKIKVLNKHLPIIVCSVEDKPNRIKKFLDSGIVSAYVLKGRDGLKELMEAINHIKHSKPFISPRLKKSLNGTLVVHIGEYEIELLKHLSNGLSQSEISELFQKSNISPSGLSSIEKRLNRLKDELQAKNTIQLVANAKDLGLI